MRHLGSTKFEPSIKVQAQAQAQGSISLIGSSAIEYCNIGIKVTVIQSRSIGKTFNRIRMALRQLTSWFYPGGSGAIHSAYRIILVSLNGLARIITSSERNPAARQYRMEIAEAEPERTRGILGTLVAICVLARNHNTHILRLFVGRMFHSQHAGIVILARTSGNLGQA